MFDLVISVLTTTSRHRADLVVENVPEVTGLLSGIFILFFEPRRQYMSSLKGRLRVISRWPPWLADPVPSNASNDALINEGARPLKSGGLRPSHAAQLSRLLNTLCDARLEPSKSTSTRPASTSISNTLVKHLPSILVSYCRAIVDPWGSLSAEVRKELEPGLGSLCERLTAGGRVDARGREGEGLGLPYGLGDGGEVEKEVWAGLWLQWRKHRYQGQG